MGQTQPRALYLTLQFMEMGIPVIVALNMMDVAAQRGMHIDTMKLGQLLGVPVVATVARRGEGKAELLQVAERIVGRICRRRRADHDPGDGGERHLGRLVHRPRQGARGGPGDPAHPGGAR